MLGYLVLSGITTGALYALVALGVVIVFKATGTVNFAHGDLFMIGGFLAAFARQPFRQLVLNQRGDNVFRRLRHETGDLAAKRRAGQDFDPG